MNGPIEPSADMRSFAGVLFQMYTALILEGFNEAQSIQIVGHVLAASWGKP